MTALCTAIRKGEPCGQPARATVDRCGTCYARDRRRAAGAQPAAPIGAEKAMSIRTTAALRAQLDALAERDGTDLAAVVRAACEAYVALRAVGDGLAAATPKPKAKRSKP